MELKILPGACILLLIVGNYFGGLWFCGECFVIVCVGEFEVFDVLFRFRAETDFVFPCG